MRLMLASHPNIDMTCRTNMWPRFYNQYGDLSHRMNFERCLDAMLHYKHVAVLKPELDRIRREFWQGPPTYARLFALVQQQHAEREGKSRWGDQTEWIERYADPIFAAYPDAKMIHMIRDPRDRYEASASRWSRGKGKVGGAIAKWLYSMDLAKRNQRRYPDRYQIVRYEALVTHPEETLCDVCAFLEEGCTPAMLMSKEHMGHKGALSTAFIGRYRQAVSKYEIAFMQRYAGRDMLAYGYSLEPIHFSLAERLHFALIDWPINWLRMLSWRSLEAIQRHFPAHLSRRPAS